MSYNYPQARFDEALLEHYDEIGDFAGYQETLKRMRQHGYIPSGPGAPFPGAPFHPQLIRDED